MSEREGISARSDHNLPPDEGDIPEGMIFKMSAYVGKNTKSIVRSSRERVLHVADEERAIHSSKRYQDLLTKAARMSVIRNPSEDIRAAIARLDFSRLDPTSAVSMRDAVWDIAALLNPESMNVGCDTLVLKQIVGELEGGGYIETDCATRLQAWIRETDAHNDQVS